MKRYAFIDTQNTETTTLKVLKFALDHEKLFSYLKDKWKCNCDVELTADVLDHVGKDTEIFLFSGDGDFEFLIQKIITQGCRVSIVSSTKRVPKGPRYSNSRLSTKLRKLTEASGSPVKFIEIDNLKFQIKKDA